MSFFGPEAMSRYEVHEAANIEQKWQAETRYNMVGCFKI